MKTHRKDTRLATLPRPVRPAPWLTGISLLLTGAAAAAADSKPDLFNTPLEDLMKVKVTSVSRKEENLSSAASAIFVITQEDIRRSGVTSIPEALRLSPGMEVGRQDSHTWAITSRGFNDEFASQLLVLIDGRSVYTPLFAGVYWDVQDLMLEDINRIEVIRGPGATLWGANAVNGVINITTKSAKDTQGLLVTGGAGNEEQGFGVRYGAQLHENGYLRVYGKWFNRDESVLPTGQEANDTWMMERGGFRYDYLPDLNNTYTLQGDIYAGLLDQSVVQPTLTPPFRKTNNDDVDTSGGNVLGRWAHTFENGSELGLKMFYDHTWRDRVADAETRDTFDVDMQHRFQIGERNDIVWGVGYDVSSDHFTGTTIAPGVPWIGLSPERRSAQLYSAFAQDEITLIENKLRLTVGTKIEHNDYTGWEFQPSGRLSYTINDKQTTWFAASRALSTPSRAEHGITINQVLPPGSPTPLGPVPFPLIYSLQGSPRMISKETISLELGYRVQPHKMVTFDVAAFYNFLDHQRTATVGAPDPASAAPAVLLPFVISNDLEGRSYGAEVSTTIQPLDWWRLRVNYSFLKLNLHPGPGAVGVLDPGFMQGDSPVHQASFRSMMDLPYHLELDGGMRYVDALKNRAVPSYAVGDIRLGWHSPDAHWELSVVGQNLFSTHQEFAPSYIPSQRTAVESSVYAKVTLRY